MYTSRIHASNKFLNFIFEKFYGVWYCEKSLEKLLELLSLIIHFTNQVSPVLQWIEFMRRRGYVLHQVSGFAPESPPEVCSRKSNLLSPHSDYCLRVINWVFLCKLLSIDSHFGKADLNEIPPSRCIGRASSWSGQQRIDPVNKTKC